MLQVEKQLEEPDKESIKKIIYLVISIGRDEIDKEKILDFLRLNVKGIQKSKINYCKVFKKLFKYLLYRNFDFTSHNLISLEIVGILKDKYKNNIEDVFWLDIYLRHLCSSFKIPDSLLIEICRKVKEYLESHRGEPITQFYKYIVNPLLAISELEEIIQLLDIIDSNNFFLQYDDNFTRKWYVAFLLRVIPILNDTLDEKYRYVINHLERILEKNNKNKLFIEGEYSNISIWDISFANILLRGKCRRFVQTLNIECLAEFYKLFLEYKKNIHPDNELDALCIQLDYAACIHYCLKNTDEIINDDFDKDISKFIYNIEKKISHKNYSNEERTNIIEDYAKREYEKIRREIELDLLFIRKIPAFSSLQISHTIIEGSSKQFPKDILRSLDIHKPSIKKDYHANYYAKSIFLTSKIKRMDVYDSKYELIQEYLDEAVKADKYHLIANANNIARNLYDCYYYYSKQRNISYVDNLEKLAVEYPLLREKDFWLFLKCIKWHDEDKELIYGLLNSCDLKDIDSKKSWSSLLEEYIRDYSGNSQIVENFNNNKNNYEFWNRIGTTINNQENKTSQDNQIAASCYRIALSFCKMPEYKQQKYKFNLYSSLGEYFNSIYSEKSSLPDPNNVADAAKYVKDVFDFLDKTDKNYNINRYYKRIKPCYTVLNNYFTQLENYFADQTEQNCISNNKYNQFNLNSVRQKLSITSKKNKWSKWKKKILTDPDLKELCSNLHLE